MSGETDKPLCAGELEWAARVWKRMSVFECAGLLYIALRYDQRTARTGEYVETMALLPWLSLGEALQQNVARALVILRLRMSRGANLL